ncbi:MAG: glycosyltransferase family 4 protein [Candidatus Kapabacteria bacterium]|nr:glycosyltransferase family 4 protein [Candidatus Kapabacteria bacterium]
MRVLLIGPQRSTFVATDVAGLSHRHRVTVINTVFGTGLQGAMRMLGFTLRVIASLVTHDVLYCWFADYHTLVPTLMARLMGKRVIVIAGGYDVGYLPEINYGARMRPLRWFCTRQTFRYASMVLAVSDYAKRQLDMLTEGRHAPAIVVYNGVLSQFVPSDISAPRERLAVTVCQGDSRTEYLRKGLPRFMHVAKMVPDVQFVVIGPTGVALDMARRDAAGIDNVTIIPGFVSLKDVIIPLYLRASAYCQFSIEETFGMVVVESMLCGCVPVTTNGGALPEVGGPHGLRADSDEGLADAVRLAMERQRHDIDAIVRHAQQFSDVRRREAVLGVVGTNATG